MRLVLSGWVRRAVPLLLLRFFTLRLRYSAGSGLPPLISTIISLCEKPLLACSFAILFSFFLSVLSWGFVVGGTLACSFTSLTQLIHYTLAHQSIGLFDTLFFRSSFPTRLVGWFVWSLPQSNKARRHALTHSFSAGVHFLHSALCRGFLHTYTLCVGCAS